MRREIICKECGLWTDPIWHQHHTCCSLQDNFLGKLWQGAQRSNNWAQGLSPASLLIFIFGNSFLLLSWGFHSIVRSVCLWLFCRAFFPSALCSDFRLLCCLFFLVFQSRYWLLMQGQNKLIPSQFAWRKADDCSVNSSRIDLSACCPSNIQAVRHILCNKNSPNYNRI